MVRAEGPLRKAFRFNESISEGKENSRNGGSSRNFLVEELRKLSNVEIGIESASISAIYLTFLTLVFFSSRIFKSFIWLIYFQRNAPYTFGTYLL